MTVLLNGTKEQNQKRLHEVNGQPVEILSGTNSLPHTPEITGNVVSPVVHPPAAIGDNGPNQR